MLQPVVLHLAQGPRLRVTPSPDCAACCRCAYQFHFLRLRSPAHWSSSGNPACCLMAHSPPMQALPAVALQMGQWQECDVLPKCLLWLSHPASP